MSTSGTGSLRERTRRITVKLFCWTSAWVVTLAIATFGPHFVWTSKAMTLVAILVNLAAGAGMILANKDHLENLDEMQRKIQLEAMALALGVALVAGLAYSTADTTDLIPFDAEIGLLVFLVTAAYGLGLLLGYRRYR